MRVFQIQRYSAIALLIFLSLHMIVVHYPPFHIDFDIILTRLESPVWKIIDIAFLFFVLMHALAGAWQVLTDLGSVWNYRKALAWAAIIIGILAFAWGSVTIWSFHPPV